MGKNSTMDSIKKVSRCVTTEYQTIGNIASGAGVDRIVTSRYLKLLKNIGFLQSLNLGRTVKYKKNNNDETRKEIEALAYVKAKKAVLKTMASTEFRLYFLREVDKKLGIGVIR